MSLPCAPAGGMQRVSSANLRSQQAGNHRRTLLQLFRISPSKIPNIGVEIRSNYYPGARMADVSQNQLDRFVHGLKSCGRDL